jgi:hypothetical protein
MADIDVIRINATKANITGGSQAVRAGQFAYATDTFQLAIKPLAGGAFRWFSDDTLQILASGATAFTGDQAHGNGSTNWGISEVRDLVLSDPAASSDDLTIDWDSGNTRWSISNPTNPLSIDSVTGPLILQLTGTNAGFGVADPDAKVEILSTTTQLKLSYDATKNATFTLATDGVLTIACSGLGMVLGNNTQVTGTLVVTSTTTLDTSLTGALRADAGVVSVGSDIIYSVEAGITASVTQTQGQQPLTKNLNEVATVANDDDVVTMPTAAAGGFVMVSHNGVNDLQIFPASGDNFEGVAVDTAITAHAHGLNIFWAEDGTTWQGKQDLVYGSATVQTAVKDIAIFVEQNGSTLESSSQIGSVKANSLYTSSFSFRETGGDSSLSFSSDTTDSVFFQISGGTNTDHVYLDIDCNANSGEEGFVRFRYGSGADCWLVGQNGGNSNRFEIMNSDFYDTFGTTFLTIEKTTGEMSLVGGAELHIFGVGEFGDANTEFVQMYHDGTNAVIDSDATGSGAVSPLILATGGTPKVTIAADGTVTSVGDLILPTSLTRIGDGVWLDHMQFDYTNHRLLIFNMDVGIGGGPPTTKLDVFGTFRAQGNSEFVLDLLVKGVTHLGGTTNYASFAADGALILEGTARVIKHINLPISGGVGVSNPTVRVTEAPYLSWTFAINDDDHHSFAAPHDMDYTRPVNIYVEWYTHLDQTDDEVNWQVMWNAKADGEAVNAGATTVTSGDVACPTQWFRKSTLVGTIAANSIAAGDIMGIDLTRIAIIDGTNPTASSIHALNIHLEYTANKIGEDAQT